MNFLKKIGQFLKKHSKQNFRKRRKQKKRKIDKYKAKKKFLTK